MPSIYDILVTVVALISITLNVILLLWIRREPNIGTLNIRTSDQGKDLYSFDVDIPLDEIPKKQRVRFRVKDHRTDILD